MAPGIQNPYLERFEELHGDFQAQHRNVAQMSREEVQAWLAKQLEVGVCRDDMCHLYSFAIPNEAAIEALAEVAPLVEIGAGNGYWAWVLRQYGVDVLAYDLFSVEKGRNNYFRERVWSEVLPGGAEEAAAHSNRTLFLCWPCFGKPWADLALQLYRGNRVVYIGDWRGCTGDDAFHDRLDRDWVETRFVEIPRWQGVHDALRVYERQSPNSGR